MLSRAHGRHGGVSFERQGHIGFQPWCSRKGGKYRLSTMNILKKPGSTRLLAIFVVYLAQSLISISRKLPVHDENDGMRLAPRVFPILDRISCLETHGGRCLDATCASPNDNYKFQCIQSTSAKSCLRARRLSYILVLVTLKRRGAQTGRVAFLGCK